MRKALCINELRAFRDKSLKKIFCRISQNFYFKFYSDYTTNAKKAPKMHGSVISLFKS